MPTITKYFPGGVVRCNVLAGGNASLYPTPNAFPTVAEWNAGVRQSAAGDYRLVPGSVLAKSGCSGTVPGRRPRAARRRAWAVARRPLTRHRIASQPTSNQPIADAGGPYTATVGALISADGTGSRDPDGAVLDYLWSWGDEVLVRAADLPAAAIHGTEWRIRDQRCRRRGDAAESGQGRGQACFGAGVPRQLRRVHGQRRRRSALPALAAQARQRQLPTTTTRSTCSSAERSMPPGAAVARIGTTSALADHPRRPR